VSEYRSITRSARFVMGWLIGALLAACIAAHAADIRDDRGKWIHLPKPPRRVITLLPSLTESVCELGACDRLVALDTYSNWPARIRPLPHLGGMEDVQIERVVALKPDLILLPSSSRAVDRLDALGLPIVVLDTKTLADVRRVLLVLGELLGGDGVGAAQRLDARLDAAARSLRPSLKGTSVYFEVSNVPFAAGAASFIGELLARLGARNIVPAALGPFPRINPELVVRGDPDVIMIAERDAGSLADRPGWTQMRAVRERRICTFTSSESEVLVRPGPRMAEAVQLMAACLQRMGKTR
jgi:iron complex transport system substrate-binding protein